MLVAAAAGMPAKLLVVLVLGVLVEVVAAGEAAAQRMVLRYWSSSETVSVWRRR